MPKSEKNVNIPVFIYHEGNQDYLKVCINHTKRYNERVILLGDSSNSHFDAEWYNAADYEKESRWYEFLKYFENFSFYDEKFVKQVFKRLFIIETFIKKNNIEKFALLDSDILIYINFSDIEYVKKYDAGCLTLFQKYEDMRWITNIGISFFSSDAFQEFISFIIKEYKLNKDELLLKWEWQQKNSVPGGIAEMPLAYLWCNSTKKKVLNLAIPGQKYGIYENAANISGNYYADEYKMNKILRIKQIRYLSGHPYFIEKNTNRLQKVDGLHFSTITKKYMKSYSKYGRATLGDYTIEILCKIKRKLKKCL